jgi:hypothetical protein
MKASFAGAKVQNKSTVKAAVPMKAKCVPALLPTGLTTTPQRIA